MHHYLMTPSDWWRGQTYFNPSRFSVSATPWEHYYHDKKGAKCTGICRLSIQPHEAKSTVSAFLLSLSLFLPPTITKNAIGTQLSVSLCKSKSGARYLDPRSPCKGHLAPRHKTAWAGQSRWILLACFTTGRTEGWLLMQREMQEAGTY